MRPYRSDNQHPPIVTIRQYQHNNGELVGRAEHTPRAARASRTATAPFVPTGSVGAEDGPVQAPTTVYGASSLKCLELLHNDALAGALLINSKPR